MCGIAGFWQRGGGAGDIESLWSMLRTIEYRGPDDSGVWNDGNVFLGHCRLSILDLTARGRQPMSNDLGDIWISYNGEIYNFKEIRRQLIGEGVRFRSNTDTEVVVKAYERWGIDCLHRFRGMFAFAIWDRRENKLFLVRDRAGVKPLFYAEQGQTVIFGSEVRAIRAYPKMSRDISLDSLFHYLQFGYISPPESIFSDIQAVRPGHVVQFRLKGSPTEQQYWDIETSYRLGLEEQKRGVWDRKSEAEVEEELEELLAQAFRYRMVSDVPVGLFLSGGIDSTIVAAILSKRLGVDLRTFTVGFNEEEFNEANTAKRIAEALGTNHRELYVGSESLLTGINRMPEIYDEPFGDSSGVPTNLLCTFAREDVKVALSADGGDELFCGYSRYTVADRYRRLQRWAPALVSHLASHILDGLPNGLLHGLYAAISLGRRRPAGFKDKILKVKRMLSGSDAAGLYEGAISDWYGNSHKKLLNGHSPVRAAGIEVMFESLDDAPFMTKMMCVDFKKYMVDDVLVKVDRASMSASLEVREPFLDHDLVEYVARLPLQYKYRHGQSKYILRKILSKYLPSGLFSRPKQGFAAPIGAWLRGPLVPAVHELLSDQQIRSDGIFDPTMVRETVACFYRGGDVAASQLWYLLEFQMWRKRWI